MPPVGAGLPAIKPAQSTSLVSDLPPSLASQLPQEFEMYMQDYYKPGNALLIDPGLSRTRRKA
jgi:hypothetical protein